MQISISRCGAGLVLLASIVAGTSGCSDSATGDLKSYTQLEGEAFDQKQVKEKSVEESPKPTQKSDKSADAATVAANSNDNKTGEPSQEPVVAKTQTGDLDKKGTKPDSQTDRDSSDPKIVQSGNPKPAAEPNGVVQAKVETPNPEAVSTDIEVKGAEANDSVAKNVKREIKLLIPDKRFRRVDPDESFRVSYDDIDLLKVLNMDPVPLNASEHFPDWLSDLDGKRIRIRGFMIPTLRAEGLTRFQLARDTQLCCFGRDPLPYDIVPVYMRSGETTRYIHLRAFDVVGVFHIENTIDEFDGSLSYVYKIDDAIVIER